jgi:peptide-methionine (S)-S-oxide reductase
MEDLLRRARGVISTRVGYTGGEMPDPTYARHYGHAEAVEVTFDPSVLAYRSLLELFLGFYAGTPDFSVIPVSARQPAHPGQ